MEIAKYNEITRWGWDCPNCGHWNEEDDDPGYQDVIICEECGNKFEPEEE